MSTNSKRNYHNSGVVHLLLLLVVVFVAVFGIGYYAYQNGLIRLPSRKKTTTIEEPSPSVSPIAEWKTYSNEDYGFEIKYPAEYFVQKDDSSVKISSSSNFEKDEFALVITIQPLSGVSYVPSDDPRILEIVNKIGYNNINKMFSYHTSANFLGDPPWGYYQIAFASQSLYQDSLLVTTRIHGQDELAASEGGTDGQIAKIAEQILSTFIITNDKTADWKIYTNNALHISLKLPLEINAYETTEGPATGERIDFAYKQPLAQNEYWFQISVTPNVNRLTADEAADNFLNAKTTLKDGEYVSIKDQPEVYNKIKIEKLTVGNLDAVSLYPVLLPKDAKLIYTTYKNFVYSISIRAGTLPVLTEESMTIFDQTLSSFQFLN